MTHTSRYTLRNQGFTLIELLVVISIISMLSSVVISSLSGARAAARDSVRVSDLRQFELGLQIFHDTYGVYPCGDNTTNSNSGDRTIDSSGSQPMLDGFINLPNDLSGRIPLVAAACPGEPKFGLFTSGIYPVSLPQDPINSMTTAGDSGNYAYGYDVLNTRQSYILYARMEKNAALMLNDGGLCDLLYEIGPGIGDMEPVMADFVGESCD